MLFYTIKIINRLRRIYLIMQQDISKSNYLNLTIEQLKTELQQLLEQGMTNRKLVVS